MREVANYLELGGHLARGVRHTEASYCLFGIYRSLSDFEKACSLGQGGMLVWRSHWKSLRLASEFRGVGFRESPRQSKLC